MRADSACRLPGTHLLDEPRADPGQRGERRGERARWPQRGPLIVQDGQHGGRVEPVQLAAERVGMPDPQPQRGQIPDWRVAQVERRDALRPRREDERDDVAILRGDAASQRQRGERLDQAGRERSGPRSGSSAPPPAQRRSPAPSCAPPRRAGPRTRPPRSAGHRPANRRSRERPARAGRRRGWHRRRCAGGQGRASAPCPSLSGSGSITPSSRRRSREMSCHPSSCELRIRSASASPLSL